MCNGVGELEKGGGREVGSGELRSGGWGRESLGQGGWVGGVWFGGWVGLEGWGGWKLGPGGLKSRIVTPTPTVF